MFAVVVTFRIKPGHVEAFLPLMLANAKTSLNEELGCQQFDVCTDPNQPDEIFLYELYDDAAAFQVHLTSAHFLEFDRKTGPMIADKAVRTYGSVVQ